MTRIRKLFFLVLAMALAAFALPSMGASQTKHFRLDTAVDGANVTVTLTNDNPSGSSAQISSAKVSVLSVTGLTIFSVVADPDSVAAFGGTVLKTSDTSFSINGLSPNLKAGDAYVVKVTVTGCGDGNQWSALVYTGSSFTGGTYVDDHFGLEQTNIACGTADCSGVTSFTVTQPGGSIELVSGKYTQEGDVCVANLSNYFITNTIAQNDILNFRVLDTSLAFRYSIFNTPQVNWSPSSQVAWACDPTGHPECWVPAQPCELQGNPTLQEKYLPWPYAKLVADNGTKITVDPAGFTAVNPVPPVPFRIFIESELLLVTQVVSATNTWKVQRCLWGTCTSVTTHQGGSVLNVMSTVLPQLPLTLPAGTSPLYVGGTPAQACYVGLTNQLIQSFDLWSHP